MLLIEKTFMLSDNPEIDDETVSLALHNGDEPDLSALVH